ncbi:MAG: tetratricopeptide repeat protein [Pirellulales bacterium]
MQTPRSRLWFTQFSASRRVAGLVLVALAVAAGQPWAAAQPIAQDKGAEEKTPAKEKAAQPAEEDQDLKDLGIDEILGKEAGKEEGEGEPAAEGDAAKVEEYMAEGKKLFDEKKYEDAFEKFGLAQEASPQTDLPEGLFYQGRAALELKQTEQALQLLNNATQLAETESETKEAPKEYYFYRGKALVEGQQYRDAAADLSKAIRLDEGYADAYHQRGVARRQGGQVKQAQKDLEKAIDLDGNKKEYYTDLGVLYYMDKKPEDAVKTLTKAIELTEAESTEGKTEEELEKGYPDPYVARGAAYIVLGKEAKSPDAARDAFSRAIADSEKAIEIRPEEGSSYFNLGLALRFLDRYQEAISALTKGIHHISPESQTFSESYLRRGICWYYLGDYGMAETDFLVGLALADDDARVHLWHGLSMAKQNRMAEALQAYDRALSLRPDFYDAHYNRGLANLALREYAKAVNSLNYFIALRPEDPRGFFARGLAQSYLGQDREALASYTRAVELNPRDAQAFYNRALINERLGRSAEAQRDRSEALRLEPGLRSNGATALAPYSQPEA